MPPTVVALQRFDVPGQETRLVLTFSDALDPTAAQDLGNYAVDSLRHVGRSGHRAGRTIRLASAAYDASSRTVTLAVHGRLKPGRTYQITVRGGVTALTGLPLLGSAGAGSDFVKVVPRPVRPAAGRR
jgi:hypothetical protein